MPDHKKNAAMQKTIDKTNNNKNVLDNFGKNSETEPIHDQSTPVTDPASGRTYDVYKDTEGKVTTVGMTGAQDATNTNAAGMKFYYTGKGAQEVAEKLALQQDEADAAEFKSDMLKSNKGKDFSQDKFMNTPRVDHMKNIKAKATQSGK